MGHIVSVYKGILCCEAVKTHWTISDMQELIHMKTHELGTKGYL